MFLPQPKGSSKSNAAEDAATVANDVAAAVIGATKSAIPNGKSVWFRSAASPKPSKAAKR